MRKVGTGYAKYFNGKYTRKGYVFQNRFRSIGIENDDQLRIIFNYIHANPVSLIEPGWKEKGVSKPENAAKFLKEYKWSSYKFHAFGRGADKLLDADSAYLSLSSVEEKRQEAYRDFIAIEQDKSMVGLIKGSINKGSILGSDRFVDKLKEKIILSTPKLRGRPRTAINP